MLELAFTTDWQRPGANRSLPDSVTVELNVSDAEDSYVLGLRGQVSIRARAVVHAWRFRTVDLPSMWHHFPRSGFSTISQYSFGGGYMTARVEKPDTEPFPREWIETHLKMEPLSAMLYGGIIEDRVMAFMDRADKAYWARQLSPTNSWRESTLLASAWAGMTIHRSGTVSL